MTSRRCTLSEITLWVNQNGHNSERRSFWVRQDEHVRSSSSVAERGKKYSKHFTSTKNNPFRGKNYPYYEGGGEWTVGESKRGGGVSWVERGGGGSGGRTNWGKGWNWTEKTIGRGLEGVKKLSRCRIRVGREYSRSCRKLFN